MFAQVRPRGRMMLLQYKNGEDLLSFWTDTTSSSIKKRPLSVWKNLGKLVMRLWYKIGQKTYCLVELSLLVRRSRRISKESSSGRVIRLVPVLIPQTHNQTSGRTWANICSLYYKDEYNTYYASGRTIALSRRISKEF